MAEFVQTMMDWQRMCMAHRTCEECPQYREYQCYNTIKRVFECGDIESLESNVLKWAAEHPVVYPTWYEYLCDMYHADWSFTIANNHIPADIAQRLGIEPKEDV